MMDISNELKQIFSDSHDFDCISMLMLTENYAEAENKCIDLINKHPNVTSLVLFLDGIRYLKAKDYAKAIQGFTEAGIAEDPYYIFEYEYWAVITEVLQNPKSGTIEFSWQQNNLYELNKLIEEDNSEVLITPQAKARYYTWRNKVNIMLERYDKAWLDISLACGLDNANEEAVYQRDFTDFLLGHNDTLSKTIKGRIENNSIDSAYLNQYYILLGNIYYTQRNYLEAVDWYKQVTDISLAELLELDEDSVISILNSKYELGLIYTKLASLGNHAAEGIEPIELAEAEADFIRTYFFEHPSVDNEILKGKASLLKATCLEEKWVPKQEISDKTGKTILAIYCDSIREFEAAEAPVFKQLAKDAHDSFEKRKNAGRDDSLNNLICKIMENKEMVALEQYVLNQKTERNNFLREGQRYPTREASELSEPVFFVLQRWNSYTPILGDRSQTECVNETKGGGYFIEAEECGIVIDPGFDFIYNFMKQGFNFCDIDYILLTHSHNDHTADFESLLTLLYAYNKQIIGEMYDNVLDRTIFQNLLHRYPHLTKEAIEEQGGLLFAKSSRRKAVTLIMPTGTYKKYESLINLDKGSYHRLILIDDNTSEIDICRNIKLKPIIASHNDQLSDNQSKGYLFLVNDKSGGSCVLIYTGDSGFDFEFYSEYIALSEDLRKDYPNAIIILLAHIGSFKHRERYGYFEVTDNLSNKKEYAAFYPNHLGRLGLARVVDIINPHYCIVSEFGEEFRGSQSVGREVYSPRVLLCEILNDAFKDHYNSETEGRDIIPRFIPADIGLCWNLGKEFREEFNNAQDKTRGKLTGQIFEDPQTGGLRYETEESRSESL